MYEDTQSLKLCQSRGNCIMKENLPLKNVYENISE